MTIAKGQTFIKKADLERKLNVYEIVIGKYGMFVRKTQRSKQKFIKSKLLAKRLRYKGINMGAYGIFVWDKK